jgi:arginine decarboxylase
MRTAFYAAYDPEGCEYVPLDGPEIDKRLKSKGRRWSRPTS